MEYWLFMFMAVLAYYVFAGFIYSHRSDDVFLSPEGANVTITNSTVLYDKMYRMESKYIGFSLPIKAIAFVPSIATLIAFVVLIVVYGRIKRTKADPYIGRLQKIPKSKTQLSIFAIVKMRLMGKRPETAEPAIDEADGTYKVLNSPDTPAKGGTITI